MDEGGREIGKGNTEGADGEGKSEKLADGVGDEEEGEGDDGGGRRAKVEEDVEGAGEHAEEEADDPHTKSEGGHVGVVDVGDGSADFWKGAVLVVYGVEVEFHSVGGRRMREGGKKREDGLYRGSTVLVVRNGVVGGRVWVSPGKIGRLREMGRGVWGDECKHIVVGAFRVAVLDDVVEGHAVWPCLRNRIAITHHPSPMASPITDGITSP